ncbi:putative bifunctional diguanylate cyclase/phosphodiesterase [Uliginosibacterium aquaticum]|uniref:EAL domain-containing protein n=1 Tax=Uliginosibacterium aquaticum TaxID=2731212 RepID=A0ABX2IFE8_9RHOO|nr:EAL domain-containing protein [Uliginosibacterium aquaticum]NSL55430.1 EAL domain-containing protein [Uliginosibacterium aquaticum]
MQGFRQFFRSASLHYALRVVAAYFVIAALWLGLLDHLVAWSQVSPALRAEILRWQGWAFVLFSAVCLFLALWWSRGRVEHRLEQLRASELRFRSLFERLPAIAVQGYAANHEVIFWNAASERLYGYRAEEARGRLLEELIVPVEWREAVRKQITDWLEKGQAIPPGELLLMRKDGSRVPVYSSHVLIENVRGEQEMYCLDVDLSALKQAEAKVRLSEAVFNDSAEGILVTDADNRIVSANDAFCRISGYSPEEVVGQTPNMFSSGRHDYGFYASMWRNLLEKGRWHGEILNRKKNGDVYPAWLAISAVEDEEGSISHFVAILSDFSERRAFEERLEFVANHDALTGLPNRVLLRDRAERALMLAARDGFSLAMVVLDLDHFKIVNDSLGHASGDRLLLAVVDRLQSCLAEADTFCRQGGDEFILLIPADAGREQLGSKLQHMLASLAQPFDIEGHSLIITASMGVAQFPDDAHSVDELLLKAETAMYHAKQAGRNAYRFFSEQMNADAHERLALQSRLSQAVERGELLLHYQPQIDLRTRRIIGAEALVRWRDRELGLVSPAKFIPVAEESGLIIPIGEWVLREACRQVQLWREQGLPELLIAVNMSALQFKRSDPVETVRQILEETGLPGHCLELELTESILIDDANLILETLRRLKALGVQLAIDDFGTGYSSLAYLKRFPIDKLKIDQSFVRDIVDDADEAAIVHTIIQLGRNLKMRTLAEGVETESQLAFLRVEGCREAQGYLFSKPLPADDFLALFRQGRALAGGSIQSVPSAVPVQ